MNGGLKMVLGITMGVVLFGLTSSLAWADGGRSCRGGGHAVGIAQHGMHSHGGRTHRLLHHLLRHQKDIGLTDEQVTKLKALALDQDRAQIRAHADVLVADRELRSLVWEKTDLSVIQAKLKESEALEANLRFMGIKAKRELYAVLTPEQREKLKAIREQMHQSQRGRMMRAEDGQSADNERIAEGLIPAPEPEPQDSAGGLQPS